MMQMHLFQGKQVDRLVGQDPEPEDGEEKGGQAGVDERLLDHLGQHMDVFIVEENTNPLLMIDVLVLFFLEHSIILSKLLDKKGNQATQPSPSPHVSHHPGEPVVDHPSFHSIRLKS